MENYNNKYMNTSRKELARILTNKDKEINKLKENLDQTCKENRELKEKYKSKIEEIKRCLNG